MCLIFCKKCCIISHEKVVHLANEKINDSTQVSGNNLIKEGRLFSPEKLEPWTFDLKHCEIYKHKKNPCYIVHVSVVSLRRMFYRSGATRLQSVSTEFTEAQLDPVFKTRFRKC